MIICIYMYIIYDSLDDEQDEGPFRWLAPSPHRPHWQQEGDEVGEGYPQLTASLEQINQQRYRTPRNTYRNKHQAEKHDGRGPSLSCQSQDISCRVVSNSGRSLGSKFPSPSCIGYRYCSARTLCYDLRCIALGYGWRTGRSWAWFLSKDSSTIASCKVFVVSDL